MAISSLDASMAGKAMKCGVSSPNLGRAPAPTSAVSNPGRSNAKYNPESALYRDLSRLIKLGVEEGWAAHEEIAGPNYRRSRIMAAGISPRREAVR
jgi:hypothetical protein